MRWRDYLEAYAERFASTSGPAATCRRSPGRGVGSSSRPRAVGSRRTTSSWRPEPIGFRAGPRSPSELDPSIVQLHSSEYRRPSQLQEGGVLLVGAGNSGADIAHEVAQTHDTWLAGKESGHIPVRIERSGKYFFRPLPLLRPPRADGADAFRPASRPQGPREGRPADPSQAEGSRSLRASSGSRGSTGSGTAFRCSRTAGRSTWRT